MSISVICMFEPAIPGERLTAAQQLNEVLGPFPDDDAAEAFIVEHGLNTWPNRTWVITQVSNPLSITGGPS